jgi:hypothetical protein
MSLALVARRIEVMTTFPPSRINVLAIISFRQGPGGVGTWPLWWCGPPDLRTVDLVARSRLGARRVGWEMELWTSCEELVGLLTLSGLADAVGVQVERQPEGGEEIGLDEVEMADDPVP